jgi:mRNA interferase MazF
VINSFYQPDKGDFVYLDFSPQAGTEQAERRPALVLSPKDFNIATSFAFVCPLTSQVKGGSFEVPVPRGAGLSGVVLSDQMRSLDWIARRAKFHSKAPQDLMFEVLGRIEAILGIDLDPAPSSGK